MNPELQFHPITRHWFEQNFNLASPPQQQGWPSIAQNQNTLICAPTGSGKTLAAFLWCIDDLLRLKLEKKRKNSSIHTLYISPLKALNNDIERNLRIPLSGIRDLVLEKSLPDPGITTHVRTGDTSSSARSKMLKSPPDILITTPESLYLLLTNAKGRLLFRDLKYIIVDEIHALCSNKRGVHLSLSLERLMPLCANDPVRIGLSATQRPLEKVAAYLGGLQYNKTLKDALPRPVKIIDTGQRKNLDIKVISPVENFSDLPEASVWPEVYKLLYKLICEHKTTLVFATMRAQTEKIARILNELHQEQHDDETTAFALAHHGSQSRETRYAIEEKLKQAQIPAVIATGSLELGIDIGSIDLVVQLESPKTVSGALQRVGRSGHLLNAASKGRIIPLYRADLDDCAALTRAMLDGEIEETHIPENVLDVLAQHIVAEVAMQEWGFDDLLTIIRQSYCYLHLTENAFRRVLEMLSGKVSEQLLPALSPRINWDTVNNKFIARRGSQLTAVLNGGTIPDRAYYGVYLQDENVKLGEMEEEFVFESHLGDVFYLGNNEYRIKDIRQDRIIVSAKKELKPRAPFWKGDLLYRDYPSHARIGEFRAELQKHIHTDALNWLQKNYHLDEAIAKNLIETFKQQLEHSGNIATNSQIIAEHFIDVSGEPLLLVQAPFGARVNGLWSVALAGILESTVGLQVQYTYDDDAFIIRLTDTKKSAVLETILQTDISQIEETLLNKLIDSPIFSVHFRYNAARALMLPRSQPHKRIPLWLQRLKAADLLQVVRKIPNFPIIAETYRELLYDVFDWPSLQTVLEGITHHDIKIKHISTMSPSPQASGLLFKMISENMYEYDRSRQSPKNTINFTDLLAEIISRESIPQVVTVEINDIFTARLQYLSHNTPVIDAEEMYSMIEKLGPINNEEIRKRVGERTNTLLDLLIKTGRIVEIAEPYSGWVVTKQKHFYQAEQARDKFHFQLRKILQNHGVISLKAISRKCNTDETSTKKHLEALLAEKTVVYGNLLKNDDHFYYCERYNFTRMYRQAISERRVFGEALERRVFDMFIFNWHFLSSPCSAPDDFIERYQGCQLPSAFFKTNILTSRLSDTDLKKSFNELIKKGELIVIADKSIGAVQSLERVIKRGSGNYFNLERMQETAKFNSDTKIVLEFLRENGASFFNDIIDATELGATNLQKSLAQLVSSGLVTNDHYETLQSLIYGKKLLPDLKENSAIKSYRRPTRGQAMRAFLERDKLRNGRWFLTTSFSVNGKKRSQEQQAEYQARMLLNRYGIVVKEWYRHESGLLPWINIFNALKKQEWQGEIYRGYFIKGLSGVQFALPEALNRLENVQSNNTYAALLSTIDPALPFGKAIGWHIFDTRSNALKIVRRDTNFLFVRDDHFKLYLENRFSKIFTCKDFYPSDLPLFINKLKNWFKENMTDAVRKIKISTIDDKPALESIHAAVFINHGFEKENSLLTLWPSAV